MNKTSGDMRVKEVARAGYIGLPALFAMVFAGSIVAAAIFMPLLFPVSYSNNPEGKGIDSAQNSTRGFFWNKDKTSKEEVYTTAGEEGEGSSAEEEINTTNQQGAVYYTVEGISQIHLPAPEPLKAIYMSQCVVGTPSFRKDLVALIEETELNAVVIDIKDYTGKISFPTNHPLLKDSVSDQCGARDMASFIRDLNMRGIFVIGRITVFQDPYYTARYPEYAVKKASAPEENWKDHKGLSFVDVSARPFWEYIVALSEESYAVGFDELNYDYIRFPSDGPMRDIYYPHSKNTPKEEALEKFFAYLHEKVSPLGVVTSADLFGMVTTNTDDLNIGQQLERALPYFDYIAPMVYPSHYPRGFNGFDNPNNHAYGVIHYSMSRAVSRTLSERSAVPSLLHNEPIYTTREVTNEDGTTREEKVLTGMYKKPVHDKLKLRPWLQDFNYGGTYDAKKVREQIQATYDAGLTSWMLWAPSNRYTREALLPFWEGEE